MKPRSAKLLAPRSAKLLAPRSAKLLAPRSAKLLASQFYYIAVMSYFEFLAKAQRRKVVPINLFPLRLRAFARIFFQSRTLPILL
jgi:hypothetical protein